MKKIIKISSIIVAVSLFVSCSESFLDTENVMQKSTENFPQNVQDAQNALTGIYSGLALTTAGVDRQSLFMVSELMSDDRLGGGGADDRYAQAVDRFLVTSGDMFNNAWAAYYKSIYRANSLLETIDMVPWTEEDMPTKEKILGETYFLRAYFYFDLARMFGSVPLITATERANNPKAPADEIFAQIAEDLQQAINLLPDQSYLAMPKTDLGRATKWAAEALMARVFLFYTGYYQQNSLPLKSGGNISKAQVVQWIDDCISRSGHDLITSDFRNLWPYAYCSERGSYAQYPVSEGLKWVREEGENVETVFAVKYSIYGSWENFHYGNGLIVFFGLRGGDSKTLLPFNLGWGWGTVNPELMNEWPKEDPRRDASVVDVENPNQIKGYQWNANQNIDETGYFQKKYVPLNVLADDGQVKLYSTELYPGTPNNNQLGNTQDLVIIRFSDVLLMAAELGSPNGQQYLDKVRSRVGLSPVPLTLENIKQERRFELAFEGIRYYDLLRWHDWDRLTTNQTNIPVKDINVAKQRSITFRAETGGFLQIPQTQIDLSEGVLTQNPGWESGQHLY